MIFITRWLGRENTCSIPVQELDTNRFAVARLYGKLANVCDELPSARWFSTSKFKAITGGGSVEGEVKFKNPFTFDPHAKQLFSANRLPQVTDDTTAFWQRIQLISFPNRFDGSVLRENILGEMLSPRERSGVLNAALEGLRMLLDSGEFYKPADLDAVRSKYVHLSDPVAAFAEDLVREDPEAWIAKADLYGAFVEYCKRHGFSPVMNSVFAKKLARLLPSIRPGRRGEEGQRFYVWHGIRLTTLEERGAEMEETQRSQKNFDRDVQGVRGTWGNPYIKLISKFLNLSIYKDADTPDTPDTPNMHAPKPLSGVAEPPITISDLKQRLWDTFGSKPI